MNYISVYNTMGDISPLTIDILGTDRLYARKGLFDICTRLSIMFIQTTVLRHQGILGDPYCGLIDFGKCRTGVYGRVFGAALNFGMNFGMILLTRHLVFKIFFTVQIYGFNSVNKPVFRALAIVNMRREFTLSGNRVSLRFANLQRHPTVLVR